ncbi:MAG: hypothetical protein AMXMBFR36_18300 [Acidobacteriota bacterium]
MRPLRLPSKLPEHARPQTRRPLILWVALAGGTAFAVGAQPPPEGPQFQVNSHTPNDQIVPAVASRLDGGFVATWESAGPFSSVRARRFAEDGAPTLPDFEVNTYTSGHQRAPAVATDGDGNFVVVWQGFDASSGDNDGYGIHGRRFDSDGDPAGAPFLVNTYTFSQQARPAVATADDGSFVVVWHSFFSPSGYDVQGRRFAADGAPLGSEFKVNDYTTGVQAVPDVAVAVDGSFVVVWQSSQSPTDPSDRSVQARRFDAAGDPLGPQFQVNTYTTGHQHFPAVAIAHDGRFLVVWESAGSGGGDTSGQSVLGRRFAADGSPAGAELQVNSYTIGEQAGADVAAVEGGGFVVSWHSSNSSGGESDRSVQAQRYNLGGDRLGPQFQVHSFTTGHQESTAVAPTTSTGGFVVTWQSVGSFDDDPAPSASIQGQLFPGPVFADGFEGGDTSAWSEVLPRNVPSAGSPAATRSSDRATRPDRGPEIRG